MIPKEFTYPVKKVAIKDILPDYKPNSKFSHFVVLEAPSGNHIVNSCSANYTLITNSEIFSPLEKHLADNFDIELKHQVHNYSKYYLDVILKDKLLPVLKKDMVYPKVRIMNSYDGSLKFSFSFGFYRLVCSNGLSLPLNVSSNIKIMHTPSAIGKWDKAIEVVSAFLGESKDMLASYQELTDRKLTFDQATERIKQVLEKTKAPSKQLEAMQERIKIESAQGLPISDWLVYNAVNYQLSHGTSKSPLHKIEKVDRQVLNYLLEN